MLSASSGKSSAAAVPYILTLVAGIVIGLIAVHVKGSGPHNAVAGTSAVGQYFKEVFGYNDDSATAEAAAHVNKMEADNIPPACLVKCQESFPLFSTAATKAAFDCHYFQVDWWKDPNGTQAIDCMRDNCNEEEQAKFRKAFECNCDKEACEFDEPFEALSQDPMRR